MNAKGSNARDNVVLKERPSGTGDGWGSEADRSLKARVSVATMPLVLKGQATQRNEG